MKYRTEGEAWWIRLVPWVFGTIALAIVAFVILLIVGMIQGTALAGQIAVNSQAARNFTSDRLEPRLSQIQDAFATTMRTASLQTPFTPTTPTAGPLNVVARVCPAGGATCQMTSDDSIAWEGAAPVQQPAASNVPVEVDYRVVLTLKTSFVHGWGRPATQVRHLLIHTYNAPPYATVSDVTLEAAAAQPTAPPQ